jgi:uncharacterized protein YdaU (DUF1376 family)
MHYYQHHIGDFIKDTNFLNNEEVGIYLKLLWLYYDTEKPLPNDTFMLSMKTGARESEAILTGILKMFFELINDEWHHTRCDKEIVEYQAFCAKQKDNGLKGGRPKNTQSKPKHNPVVSQTEPKITLTTNHKPLTTNHKPIVKTKANGQALPDWLPIPEFQAFLEYRKSKRNALNEHAQKLLIEKLSGLQTDGQDLVAVLNQSILNGWSGVFPIKVDFVKGKLQGDALTQHNAQVMREFIGTQTND